MMQRSIGEHRGRNHFGGGQQRPPPTAKTSQTAKTSIVSPELDQSPSAKRPPIGDEEVAPKSA